MSFLFFCDMLLYHWLIGIHISRQHGDLNFRVKIFFTGYFHSWRDDHCWAPMVQQCSTTSQKNEHLNCTAMKAQKHSKSCISAINRHMEVTFDICNILRIPNFIRMQMVLRLCPKLSWFDIKWSKNIVEISFCSYNYISIPLTMMIKLGMVIVT